MGDKVLRWYDEEASRTEQMDVVHEVEVHSPAEHRRAWLEAMRRLNAVEDPLARRLIALHRDCGDGEYQCRACGSADEEPFSRFPCETLELVAEHHGVSWPLGL